MKAENDVITPTKGGLFSGLLSEYEIETPYKKVKRSHIDVYVDSLLQKSKKYKFPYRKLVSRERARRVNFLAENVVAACVDRIKLKNEKMSIMSRIKIWRKMHSQF